MTFYRLYRSFSPYRPTALLGALDVPAATGGDGAMVFVNTGGCLQPPVFADGGTVPL